jgi:pentatricopeptide repeat protein
MVSIVEFLSTSSAMELLRMVWMEVAMASFAAMMYFTLTGYFTTVPEKKAKSAQKLGQGQKKSSGKAHQPERSLNGYQLVTKAIREGEVSEAIALLKAMPESSDGSMPANIAPRLLMAIAKSPNFEDLMASVLSMKIEARSFEAVVSEAAKNKDEAACRQFCAMLRLMSVPQTPQMLEALAKGCAADARSLRKLLEEVEMPLPRIFAKVVLEACTSLKDVDLAAEVFEKVDASDEAFLRGVVENAVDKPSTSIAPDMPSSKEAAQTKEIRACGKSGDIAGALKIFQQAREHSTSSHLYNAIMDVCVECDNLAKAIEHFTEARKNGCADISSYNIAIKGHLVRANVDSAKKLFQELAEKNLTPTRATYHAFLHFHVKGQNPECAWKVIEEMQAADILPSAVTCSILLKGKLDSRADLNKVFSLVDKIDPMDEVLFHAVAEVCVRTSQLQLLTKYQAKLSSQGSSPTLTAPTYGSMIKAYGQARDTNQVQKLWSDMLQQGVQPTAITLGCMIEALVMNGCTAEAWRLVQKMRNDEGTKILVNTVIYSTIIKGFAYAKETDKVMALYEEMKANDIQPNNITFNTILNAFARGGAMHRVGALLEDMKACNPPAEPDIVTYSTIVKGFCNSGSFDRALAIMKDMKAEGKLAPDEMMYNSLLDGCAKEQKPTEALALLEDMKQSGVAPSNYTLSMLIKLMGRCRRLNQAFSIVEDIRREYGLKLNIQVYTCLIQACFNNRQALKAVGLHEKIIKEGLIPDEMLYSCLVKGCLQAHLVDQAVQLAKCAHGVGSVTLKGTPPGLKADAVSAVVSALGGNGAPDAQAFLSECQSGKSSSHHRGKGAGKGGAAAAAPWRQQRQ